MKTEITPLLIVIKLEQFDYNGAAAIGFVMLLVSFVMLFADQPGAGLGPAAARQGRPPRRVAARRRNRAGSAAVAPPTRARETPAGGCWSRWAVHRLALGFLALLLLAPLAPCSRRRSRRAGAPTSSSSTIRTRGAAIRLTLLTAAIVVPVNTLFGICGGLGDREVRVPGQEPADHADRPAVRGFAGHLGPGLRAAVRRAGLVRAVAAGARHPGHLRRAGHRAGDPVRDLSVRRARADSADAAAGQRRRGGRDHARRRRPGRPSCASRCRRSAGACSTA